MKKQILASLLVATALFAGCDDYNDRLDGFVVDNAITDVAQFEGEFTGNYPSEGYFKDKASLQTALNTMLKAKFPYCDKGSSAKVSVNYGDIAKDYEDVKADVEYELTNEDYDAMGTEAGQPGKYNNFDANMDVDAYLKAFCATKYGDLAVGKIVNITYKFYASGATSALVKTYQKVSGGWNEYSSFTPDKKYTLTDDDYDAMGTASGTPGKYNNFDSNMDVDFYLTTFLKQTFPYTKTGSTCEVTYKYYANKVTTDKTALYKYDGNAWAAYDPFAEILTVSTKIAEMTYDGAAWTIVRLLGGTKVIKFAEADYQALVDWVTANKPAFLSTTNAAQEEYYFGASSKYSNINNNYSTWQKYYNVDGYLTGKTDAEIQTIMDEHIEYGIAEILLPSWISKTDSGISYVVVYNVYAGRGKGDYAMSFMYNEETGKYEKTAGPVAR
ncbi:hypothetical protein [Bacteroides helcogenes]|uniref:DUF5017 domain-containing protein n=1 Tax=Bacteroides helcogenes (strain ATCC 35417 / DSM 20613 / JCM 6297 / CCUG 15421 / P 36-108) TaxID=693979 RepID=E6SWD4_BACT6|nr:hypothetical protein [Bacteroides helcogenes]ADV44595.1 hypothetical protein Bache_2641 [Bacteroides helcogenes P 36-108]MDY5238884.1 hypothetical protein [Bacteroides helcogenes]